METTRTIMQVGETVEQHGFRIHRYEGSLEVTDLAHAGKRGKRVAMVVVQGWQKADELLQLSIRILAAATYADADALAWASGLTVYRRELRGIDVEPPTGSAAAEIRIGNATMSLYCSMRSFRLRDLTDPHNEPTVIPAPGAKSGPAKLHKWLRANLDAAQAMTFAQLDRTLSDLGVRSHYYCAMD